MFRRQQQQQRPGLRTPRHIHGQKAEHGEGVADWCDKEGTEEQEQAGRKQERKEEKTRPAARERLAAGTP